MSQQTAAGYTAPHNYEDMYRAYFAYIVHLVGRCGIEESNREDVAHEIFLRLMEREFLDQYDPDLLFNHGGRLCRTKFQYFLSSVVVTYARGHRDKQLRIRRREKLIMSPLPPDQTNDPAAAGKHASPNHLRGYGAVEPDPADAVVEKLMEEDNADAVRAYLADIPMRSSHDRCDLVALFNAVRAQILEFGTYDLKKLAALFDVSSTAMNTWMWWLKANLADLYGLPLPPKRAHTVKAA